jgi:hypothetical protein
VIPLLMLLIFAAVTLGHALYVRHGLSELAAAVARTCALEQDAGQRCRAAADRLVVTGNRWCAGGVGVRIDAVPLAGLRYVRGLKVQLDCRFTGGVGRAYLAASNLRIADLSVSALAPLSTAGTEDGGAGEEGP